MADLTKKQLDALGALRFWTERSGRAAPLAPRIEAELAPLVDAGLVAREGSLWSLTPAGDAVAPRDRYVRHEQVGDVRFIDERTGAGVAVWYDYDGGSKVEDAWLCEHMSAFAGGAWHISRRHAGGNGHEGVDLVSAT
jgi:hypothetical protein